MHLPYPVRSLILAGGGLALLATLATLLAAPAPQPTTQPAPRPGQLLPRLGDEIMVCGQLFHTGGAPVILWTDPGGYDAYRVERRFVPYDQSSWVATTQSTTAIKWPNRYSLRESVLTPAEIERVRGGGWDLPLLQQKIDQFVIHYDAAGLSRACFAALQDGRGLSAHFLLDLDGTIYQTLDLKERAWHATIANSRSIGIEIANVGAYTPGEDNPLDQWYVKGPGGRFRLSIPSRITETGLRNPAYSARPARNRLIRGDIHGHPRIQYDFTPEQYASLIKLTATLCAIFPNLPCDYPRDSAGRLIRTKLPDDQFEKYHGLLGHYHVQLDKIDPGPAFQWDHVVNNARKLLPPAPATQPTTRPALPALPPLPALPSTTRPAPATAPAAVPFRYEQP